MAQARLSLHAGNTRWRRNPEHESAQRRMIVEQLREQPIPLLASHRPDVDRVVGLVFLGHIRRPAESLLEHSQRCSPSAGSPSPRCAFSDFTAAGSSSSSAAALARPGSLASPAAQVAAGAAGFRQLDRGETRRGSLLRDSATSLIDSGPAPSRARAVGSVP